MHLRDLSPGDRFALAFRPAQTGQVERHSESGTTVTWEAHERTVWSEELGKSVTYTHRQERQQISSGTEVVYLPSSRKARQKALLTLEKGANEHA